MKKVKILVLVFGMLLLLSCNKEEKIEVYPTYFKVGYYGNRLGEKLKELPAPISIVLTRKGIAAEYANKQVSVKSLYEDFTTAKVYCCTGIKGNEPVIFIDRDSNFTINYFNNPTFAGFYFNNPCIEITKINEEYIQGTFAFSGPTSTYSASVGYTIKGEFSGKLQ